MSGFEVLLLDKIIFKKVSFILIFPISIKPNPCHDTRQDAFSLVVWVKSDALLVLFINKH